MRRKAKQLLAVGALVALCGGCRSVELTQPLSPPLTGSERLALWTAILAVPLVGAALIVLRPGSPRPSRYVRAGAFVYAAAGCAVLLGLAIGAGAAVRAGGLGCPTTADPDRPETILALGCSPGYDDSGLLLVVAALVGVPLALGLIAAALALLRGEGITLFALLAMAVAGAAVAGLASARAADGTRRVALIVCVVASLAGLCLLLDVLTSRHDEPSSPAASSGSPSTRSQRSLQSAHR
jgi:hypothetical protein